ncbi:MAG: DUF354 domain-containing protein [Microbacter sp.]
MRILVDICHPAHVHLFKHAIRQLREHGHFVVVTVKDIPAAKKLLEYEEIDFISLPGSKKDSLAGKAWTQCRDLYHLGRIVRSHRVEIGIGSSVSVAQLGRLMGFPSLFFDDDDDAVEPLTLRFAHPFAHVVLSPAALKDHRKKNPTVFYPGSHELAYLHPKQFVPEPAVLESIGLNMEMPFFVMRFNAFKAHHDGNVRGLTLQQKLELISMLEPHGRVLITTERSIENELRSYQMNIPPHQIHHLLYYATLFIGDSQTMTSEAAILGTPALRCNTLVGQLSVIEELTHRYQLAYGFQPEAFDAMKETIRVLLSNTHLKDEWQTKRNLFLADKIDVTAFFVWFIEHYPESQAMILQQPDFFFSFY